MRSGMASCSIAATPAIWRLPPDASATASSVTVVIRPPPANRLGRYRATDTDTPTNSAVVMAGASIGSATRR